MTSELLDRLLGMISEVFGREASGSDSMFTMGGDSLTAVELVEVIENRFKVDAEIEVLFDVEDFAALAEHIQALAPTRPLHSTELADG